MARRPLASKASLSPADRKVSLDISLLTSTLAKRVDDACSGPALLAAGGNAMPSQITIAIVESGIMVRNDAGVYANDREARRVAFNGRLTELLQPHAQEMQAFRSLFPEIGPGLAVTMQRSAMPGKSSYVSMWDFHGFETLLLQGFMAKGIDKITEKLEVLGEILPPYSANDPVWSVDRASTSGGTMTDVQEIMGTSTRDIVRHQVRAPSAEMALLKVCAKFAKAEDLKALLGDSLGADTALARALRGSSVVIEVRNGGDMFDMSATATPGTDTPDPDDEPN